MKPDLKIYVDPDLHTRITMAHERLVACKRKVSRNDVIVQLIEDGFSRWQGDVDITSRIESSVSKLTDMIARQDRMIRSILLTMADGDKDEYHAIISKIEKMENDDV